MASTPRRRSLARRGAVILAALLVAIWAVPGSTAAPTRAVTTPAGDTIVVALAQPHPAALGAFLSDLQRRGSAEYHHFLTPAQFTRRFGASQAQVTAVMARLRGIGLAGARVSNDHLFVSVPTAARDARRAEAGSTQTQTQTRTEAGAVRSALGSLASAVITPAEMPVMEPGAIRLPRRAGARADLRAPRSTQAPVGVDGGATPCPAADAADAYTAPQLASAYNFDGMYAAGYHGEGMTAAVVEFGGYHSGNISAFDNCYGIHTPVSRVLLAGGTGGPANSTEDEVTLDIETLNEMAPDLAGIDVYEAPNDGSGELEAYDAFVQADAASVLSVSWGECEQSLSQSYERLLAVIAEQAAAQGQQIFAADGDTGSLGCRGEPLAAGRSLSADTEAALPWVTGVGGTDLSQASTQPNATVHREAVWNDGIGAGGGGQSVVWAMPSWQSDYLKSTGDHPQGLADDCGAPDGGDCRMEPDISFDADGEEGGADASELQAPAGPKPPQFRDVGDIGSPGYAFYCASSDCGGSAEDGGGWQPVSGTSAATPVAAAAAVLWDQQAKASGVALGFLNPPMYAIAANPTDYARDFYDVTGGNNDDQYTTLGCLGGCTTHLYSAGPGYDMATGLGAVNVANLGTDLMANAGAITLTPDSEQMYGDTGGGPSTTAPVSVSFPSNAATGNGYTASSDASWLVLDHPGGTAPRRLAWHVDPAGLAAGTYTGQITVTGPNGSTATLSVAYTVSAPAKIRLLTRSLHFSERQVKPYGARHIAICTTPLWGDELEFDGTLPGAASESTPGDEAPSTRRTLVFADGEGAGSVLHYSVDLIDLSWAGTDADPHGHPFAFQRQPGQPLVASQGSIGGRMRAEIKLASTANENLLGGDPALQQGTYHGTVQITDLADPADRATVPVTLTLGNGRGTPRIGTDRRSLAVSLAPGHARTLELGLTDPGGACSYGYSLSTSASWLGSAPARRAGTVPAHGVRRVPISVSAPAGMAPGVYHATVTVASANAAQASLSVPVTLTVK